MLSDINKSIHAAYMQVVKNSSPVKPLTEVDSETSVNGIMEQDYTGQISDPEERARIDDLKKVYATFGGAEGLRRARHFDRVGMLRATKQEKELLYRMTDENGTVKPRVGPEHEMTEGAAPWEANWKKAALASKKAQQTPSIATHKRAAELHRQGASDEWSPWKDKHIEAAEKHEKAVKMRGGATVKNEVTEGAPELLKAEMPLVRHIEKELADKGLKKGDEDYYKVFDSTLAMYRKFGNTDAIKAQGVTEATADHAELAKLAHDAYVQANRKGNGTLAAHYLKLHMKHKEDASKEVEKNKQEKQKVEEGISYALSAANSNAEFDRTYTHVPKGYKGRVDLDIGDSSEYISAMNSLNDAAKKAGHHVECGRSGNEMSVYSKTMNSDELGNFVSKNHKQGVAEGLKDPKDNPCWDGYEPVGTKTKDGKQVPNCVPVADSVQVAENGDCEKPVEESDDTGGDGSAYNKYLLATTGDLPRSKEAYMRVEEADENEWIRIGSEQNDRSRSARNLIKNELTTQGNLTVIDKIKAAKNPDRIKEMLDKAISHPDPKIRKAAAGHPDATKEHLDLALDDEHPGVRAAAAYNLYATKEHLDKALNDKVWEVRAAAADNPVATKEHLDKALSDEGYEVRAYAATNSSASKEHLDMALSDKHPTVRAAAASNVRANKEHLNKALDDADYNVRTKAASNPSATKENLDKALDDNDLDVRVYAAENPSATKENLDKALDDDDYNVRAAAVAPDSNPTSKHIYRALSDEEPYVRLKAAEHYNATSKHIARALRDDEPDVRAAAAINPSATKEHLDKALNDEDQYVRSAAAGNTNATKEHLDKALRDQEPRVRQVAAASSNLNKEQIYRALHDIDPVVREAAEDTRKRKPPELNKTVKLPLNNVIDI